uniref:Uncharacterized protein n=1 Tax=Amphilophus citrinellus TaxID=61819 RepID=A0A3Q0RVV8_AMPCI
CQSELIWESWMKIIKRRLSMSLRSARPVDDSLSELAEQMALDEPSTSNPGRQPPWMAPEVYAPLYPCIIKNILRFSCAFGFIKLLIYF